MNDLVIYLLVIIIASAGILVCLPVRRENRRLPSSLGSSFSSSLGNKVRYLTAGAVTRSPYSRVKRRIRAEMTDREIFEAIGFLRNLIAADRGGKISADSLLEQLAGREGSLRPAFVKALSLLRVGKKDEMIKRFSEAGDTAMSRDFIRMIVGWDDVSPDKLSSTLLSYQNTMKEIRTTELKRRNEILSDLVFFPVIANVLAVFMNFIFIAYFIGQQDLLRQMFT